MDQDKIGKFIAKLRKDKKMTQEELGEKLGVNSKSVSRWENGKCMPDVSLLVPLSKELGMSVNDLLSGKKNDKEGYQKTFEENIVNIVSKVDKDNKKKRLRAIWISISIIFVAFPLLILCSSQFFEAPWISFSSFKIMNKANQFFEALEKNDIGTIDKIMTDNVEIMCWINNDDSHRTKNNLLDNLNVLKNHHRFEYTSFKFKQAYYSNVIVTPDPPDENSCVTPKIGFLVQYEMCFKDWSDRACINLTFQIDDNNKLIFYSDATDSNLHNKVLDKYNPASFGNVYYNKLHLYIDAVFNGFPQEEIEEQERMFEK